MSARVPAARQSLDYYRFRCEIAPRLADIDGGQHVNNAVVALYYEESRAHLHLLASGREAVLGERRGAGVVVHVTIDFLGEILYGSPVIGAAVIAGYGRSTYRVEQALFQNDRCVGVCDTIICWREQGRVAPPPAKLREQLLPYTL
jgi:acyl-CoA thioester hydrolase